MADEHNARRKPRRVKGCYNCSQRRINCDRGTPCQKCVKKGLQCSGLGIRYRFNNGVASRGNLAGKKIPIKNSSPDPTSTYAANQEPTVESTAQEETQNEDALSMPTVLPTVVLDHLDRRSRFLLNYFSQNVAPAMIAINTLFNGYNDLILPMSEHDVMVRNSILAASMSHLSIKHAQWKKDAAKYHMAAIKGLTQQIHGGHLESALVYSSLSTMILLLIEEMITARTRDFQILLRMVQSFIQSQGGEVIIEKSPVGKFLIQQNRKMSLYSAPLISERLAIETFQNVTRKDLEFLYGSLETNPTNFPLILKVAGLIHGAASVYLARACNASDEHVSMLVQNFLAETATFNASSPGGHILIWPFFIVGTECSLEADRQFVIEQLNSLWNATGFGSTLYATELLNSIWQGRYGADVTKFLADKVEGFIM